MHMDKLLLLFFSDICALKSPSQSPPFGFIIIIIHLVKIRLTSIK